MISDEIECRLEVAMRSDEFSPLGSGATVDDDEDASGIEKNKNVSDLG